MGDPIYIIDPKTRSPMPIRPVSFADINIKERADLEEWVLAHPEILGESLLIVTSEFSRFDKSSRRLDVLALDKSGILVVIELKLDVAGSLADQQAIRYAAFCSTMNIADVAALYGQYHGVTEAQGEKAIAEFLAVDRLPDLGDRPRIIIAAGSLDDQELTACVLWLRRFGLDITCIELTPYRLPSGDRILLVPRTIIPLPEARDYVIKAERKEVLRGHEQRERSQTERLWRAIGDAFNGLGLQFRTTGNSRNNFMQVPIGRGGLHYEWFLRKGENCIDVALHFESDDVTKNQRMLQPIEAQKYEIEKDVGLPLQTGPFGKKWMQARFALPYDGAAPLNEIAPKAADLMKTLIDRTWPTVEKLKEM